MENKKVWFKRMWWGGRLVPCSKQGWVISLIAALLILFFGANFDGPVTNNFSLATNGIAFSITILAFVTIAYIKAE